MSLPFARYLGFVPLARLPIAPLAAVQAACQLAAERDLRHAPTPISGGMRKALAKERGAQDALRYRTPRSRGAAQMQHAYGLVQAVCGHCRHVMYFDEIEPGTEASVRCDRCRRSICG